MKRNPEENLHQKTDVALMLGRLKKWNMSLNIIIGSFIGVFIGHSMYRCIDFKNHPGLYEIQSAPWYTSILVYGIGTSIVIFTAIILKFLIKENAK